jgi:hypothetical protein
MRPSEAYDAPPSHATPLHRIVDAYTENVRGHSPEHEGSLRAFFCLLGIRGTESAQQSCDDAP